MQLGKNTATSSGLNDGPGTTHSIDRAELAMPASSVAGNKNRKRKRCAERKEQTAAQQKKALCETRMQPFM